LQPTINRRRCTPINWIRMRGSTGVFIAFSPECS
jgi:hypothetical protein